MTKHTSERAATKFHSIRFCALFISRGGVELNGMSALHLKEKNAPLFCPRFFAGALVQYLAGRSVLAAGDTLLSW